MGHDGSQSPRLRIRMGPTEKAAILVLRAARIRHTYGQVWGLFRMHERACRGNAAELANYPAMHGQYAGRPMYRRASAHNASSEDPHNARHRNAHRSFLGREL